ncbi:YT521-B-like domain-containing protein [Powellomyces hirtus]|nr:YT521-B-like domain-containing protein [Powellomyces hirtus]
MQNGHSHSRLPTTTITTQLDYPDPSPLRRHSLAHAAAPERYHSDARRVSAPPPSMMVGGEPTDARQRRYSDSTSPAAPPSLAPISQCMPGGSELMVKRDDSPWEGVDWSFGLDRQPRDQGPAVDTGFSPLVSHYRSRSHDIPSRPRPESSPADIDSAFYATRRRLMLQEQQHLSPVAPGAGQWMGDADFAQRRSSTGDLVAPQKPSAEQYYLPREADLGKREMNLGFGSIPQDDLLYRDVRFTRGGGPGPSGLSSMLSHSHSPQPSPHRRTLSSTGPSTRSVIPPRDMSPWADDRLDPSTSRTSLLGRGPATGAPSAGWSEAAARFMDTRPEDFLRPSSSKSASSFGRPPMDEPGLTHPAGSSSALMQQPTTTHVPATPTVPDVATQRRVAAFVAERGINPSLRGFNVSPANARYFVLKSNSSSNIHTSINYGVWSSTELGNRRLDNAFRSTAASTTAATNTSNPISLSEPPTATTPGAVYLFFSVTASGRFCGVARMTSPIDWTRSEDIWEQQKKYKGTFELEWIFVKDVPHRAVRHLRVSANEDKPVSNSRDTQELTQDIGHDLLRIFAEYQSQSSVLYDMFGTPTDTATAE